MTLTLDNLNFTFIAQEAGLSRSYVSRVLRGKANPTVDTLTRVAAVLEVTNDELLWAINGGCDHG